MKRLSKVLLSAGLILGLASCGDVVLESTNNVTTKPTEVKPTQKAEPTQSETPKSEAYKKVVGLSAKTKANMSASGYLSDVNNDYSKYVGTDAYKVVNTPEELVEALLLARLDYETKVTEHDEGYIVRNNVRKNETNWKNAIAKGLYLKKSDGTYTKIPDDTPLSDESYTTAMVYYEDSPLVSAKYVQTLKKEQTVHVIEIASDLNLGYNLISEEAKKSGLVSNYIKEKNAKTVTMSQMATENGISQIAIERTNDLLIYSKNGARITHGGFKINYCNNVSIRNLDMDEMWQWEDTSNPKQVKMGDYDTFGWAYFKIGFSDNIWIDHCSFGKSFDGQIDVANPYYESLGTASSAPYNADGTSDVHISWCDFHAGDSSEDGYIYKMMKKIEDEYEAANGASTNNLYYKALRDAGLSFEQILKGIAIPQKKAFLLGDSGSEYYYNLNLNVSIANSKFKNIEDRIPKLRGGNAYMYNCIVDNFEYMSYRSQMKSIAASAVSKINSSWKCAFTSQGIVVGNGGSVCANSCIFKGIRSLIKNNDSTIVNASSYDGATNNGGYHLVNFTYQATESSPIISDEANVSIDCSGGTTSTSNFKWNTLDGKEPFNPQTYLLDELSSILDSDIGVGVVSGLDEMLLISNYNNIN